MKIISRQNMKFALVAVGIIVVMMAFRSRKPKSDIVGTPVSLAPIRIDTSPKALPQPVAQTPPVQSFVNQIPVQQVATLAPPATLVEPSVTVEPTEVPAPSIMVEDLAMVESPVGFENPANFESPEAFEFPPTIDSPPAETPTPAENPATGYQATGYQDFGNVGSSDGIVVDFSLTEAKPSIEPQRDETPDPAAAELDTDFDSDLSLSVDSDFEPEAFQQGPLEAAGGYQPNNQAVPVDFVEPVTEPTVHVSTVFLDDAAAQKAVHHIEYGKSLARRNATEAASQEFIGGVLAESNDAATGGNSHAVALRNGMVAIREAIDFKSDDPQRQIVMNVPRIIEGHESAILGADEARNITASMAMRRYFEFAGRELGKCGGNNPVAAEALYCLGKMRTVTSATDPDPESIEINESIIFHHASLAADPSNFRSANELGVLLAKNGHLDAAETSDSCGLVESGQSPQTPRNGSAPTARQPCRSGVPDRTVQSGKHPDSRPHSVG